MKPNMIDSLVAHKIVWPKDGSMPPDQIIPSYSGDPMSALEAANAFTRNGGTVRMLKAAQHVWEATVWAVPRGRQHTESGPFAAALCRAMLAAVGVSVKSSDG